MQRLRQKASVGRDKGRKVNIHSCAPDGIAEPRWDWAQTSITFPAEPDAVSQRSANIGLLGNDFPFPRVPARPSCSLKEKEKTSSFYQK